MILEVKPNSLTNSSLRSPFVIIVKPILGPDKFLIKWKQGKKKVFSHYYTRNMENVCNGTDVSTEFVVASLNTL